MEQQYTWNSENTRFARVRQNRPVVIVRIDTLTQFNGSSASSLYQLAGQVTAQDGAGISRQVV
jgi:hypothetical protein